MVHDSRTESARKLHGFKRWTFKSFSFIHAFSYILWDAEVLDTERRRGIGHSWRKPYFRRMVTFCLPLSLRNFHTILGASGRASPSLSCMNLRNIVSQIPNDAYICQKRSLVSNCNFDLLNATQLFFSGIKETLFDWAFLWPLNTPCHIKTLNDSFTFFVKA